MDQQSSQPRGTNDPKVDAVYYLVRELPNRSSGERLGATVDAV
jgi:hypothetical protein